MTFIQVGGRDHVGRRHNAVYQGFFPYARGEGDWVRAHFSATFGVKGEMHMGWHDRLPVKPGIQFQIPPDVVTGRFWIQETGADSPREVEFREAVEVIRAGRAAHVYPVKGNRWIPADELGIL